MKTIHNKKAQIYGLSAFLYALAIAIILIVGLLGMTKEFETKSEASLYRFNAVLASKTADTVKKIMEQERSYALDKAFYITGAYGGYSSYKDIVNAGNCTYAVCAKNCPSGFACIQGTNNCTYIAAESVRKICQEEAEFNYPGYGSSFDCDVVSGNCKNGTVGGVNFTLEGSYPMNNYGYCAKGVANTAEFLKNTKDGNFDDGTLDTAKDCYPNIVDKSGGTSCNVKKIGLSYLAEKIVPYWKTESTTCIPDENKVMKVFNEMINFFAAPDQSITGALTSSTRRSVNFNYKLDLGCYPGKEGCDAKNTDTVEASWMPVGKSDITIASPLPPDKPVIEYTFSPFVSSSAKTKFFGLYKESKSAAEGNFESFMHSGYSPIPNVVDEDFTIAKKYISTVSGVRTQTHIDNCTNYPFPSDVCTYNASDQPRPFPALVEDAVEKMPDGLYTCVPEPDPTKVSHTYPHDCKVFTTRNTNDGLLHIDSFGGYCNEQHDGQQATDDAAMKCVMYKTINNMNAKIMQGEPGPKITQDSNMSWKYEFYSFNLTFRGTDKGSMNSLVYNSTQPGSGCSDTCVNATAVNPYKYCPGTIDVQGNVTSSGCSGFSSLCFTIPKGGFGSGFNDLPDIGGGNVNYCVDTSKTNINMSATVKFLTGSDNLCRAIIPVQMNVSGAPLNCVSPNKVTYNKTITLLGTNPVMIYFQIINWTTNCTGTKTNFFWSLLEKYPGDTAYKGMTNLSTCSEPFVTYEASINPNKCGDKMNRGGFNCTGDSDCAQGSGAATCGSLICSPSAVCTYCGNLGRSCCSFSWCKSPYICSSGTCIENTTFVQPGGGGLPYPGGGGGSGLGRD
jgi:hypothetical protein